MKPPRRPEAPAFDEAAVLAGPASSVRSTSERRRDDRVTMTDETLKRAEPVQDELEVYTRAAEVARALAAELSAAFAAEFDKRLLEQTRPKPLSGGQRRPVQIALAVGPHGAPYLAALADDGTIWLWEEVHRAWFQRKPLPAD